MRLLALNVGLNIEKIAHDSKIFQFVGSEQYKRGIALHPPNSYYRHIHKRLFSRGIFPKREIANFTKQVEKLNGEGNGDQRIYILSK